MSNLKNGSSGEDVKKLQNALVSAGYDIGSSGADGIYGAKTEAAVRQYQKDNGLAVDGIAGVNTQGSLYGSGSTSSASTASQQTAAPTTQTYKSYDPNTDANYQAALSALQNTLNSRPTYSGTYDGQLADAYNAIVNRDKFQYDVNSDTLYQQYKDQYTTLGQQAMRDTMGQAAALTGGYGSSYGQSVGQQQYDAYLQKLNDVIPDLYGMAYDRYQDEGTQLYQQYQMLGDMRDNEYSQYLNSMDLWSNDVSRAQSALDTAYQQGVYANETDYDRTQDEKSWAASMISNYGIDYTDDELASMGLSRDEANALKSSYLASTTKTTTSSGGSSSGSGSSSSSSDGSTADWTGLFDWITKYGYDNADIYLDNNYAALGFKNKTAAKDAWEYYATTHGGKEKLDFGTIDANAAAESERQQYVVDYAKQDSRRDRTPAWSYLSASEKSKYNTYYQQANDTLGIGRGESSPLLTPKAYLEQTGSLNDYKEYTEEAVKSTGRENQIRKGT